MNENKLQLKKESGWFYNKKYFLKSTRPSAVSIPPPPKDTSSFYFIHSLVFFFISFTFTLSLFIHSLPLYSLSLSSLSLFIHSLYLLSPSVLPPPPSRLSLSWIYYTPGIVVFYFPHITLQELLPSVLVQKKTSSLSFVSMK